MLVHSLFSDAMLPLIQVRPLKAGVLHVQSTEKFDTTTLEPVNDYTERSYGASYDLQVTGQTYMAIQHALDFSEGHTNKSLADSGKTYLITAFDIENKRFEYICKNGAVNKLDIT